ncbi:hypothetical protein PV327_008906 [Microctonus hyperodae]|uniref:Uncharacterized protein n=1 Tax=Microctonus hyperodae TaxID=165561 RepID=A0AA39FSP0_MICHY|nr:hypothetical protein PV327_008906 [Microctonus hyperodae]
MLYHTFLLSFMITILLSDLHGGSGHRILGIFPFHTKSHMIMFEQLMKELIKRGHQIDVINTLPQEKPYPNYTDIEIPLFMPDFINNMNYSSFCQVRDNFLEMCLSMAGNDACKAVFSHPKVQEIIETPPTDPPYDVVIMEVSF